MYRVIPPTCFVLFRLSFAAAAYDDEILTRRDRRRSVNTTLEYFYKADRPRDS